MKRSAETGENTGETPVNGNTTCKKGTRRARTCKSCTRGGHEKTRENRLTVLPG